MHANRINREKTLRKIATLRVMISSLFGIGALGLGVYLGLVIGNVVEIDWAIFIAVLAGLIVGNTFAWMYLDDRELKC